MQVQCGQCGRTLEIDDGLAGQAASCPHCGRQITMPPLDARLQPAAQAAEQIELDENGGDGGFAEQAREMIARRVHFVCGACGKKLAVGMRQAGKEGRCPACKTPLVIPTFTEQADDFEFHTASKRRQSSEAETSDEAHPLNEMALHADEWSPETPPAGRGRGPAQRIMTLAAIAIIGLIGVIGVHVAMNWSDGADSLQPELAGGQQAAVDTKPPQPQTAPVTRQAANGQKQVPSAPAVQRAEFGVEDVNVDVFATEGYLPAEVGWVYWKVTVSIKAGSTGLTAKTANGVSLSSGAQTLPCLGVQRGRGVLPVVAQQAVIAVQPGKQVQETLVFKVPQDARQGVLQVAGLGKVDIAVEPLSGGTAANLPGLYAELPPRNLKPMLSHPVMAALQAADNHKLNIKAVGKRFELSIPAANVTGTAKPLADDILEMQLQHGGDILKCKLRLLNDGKTVILYLADEAFHQLTYTKV